MIIQETLERKIWLNNPLIKRWVVSRVQSIQKSIVSQINRVYRRALAWYRDQYFISSAYTDMKLYAKRNEDIFIAVLLASGIIGYLFALTATNILFKSLLAVYVVAEALGFNMAAVFFMAGFSCSLLFAWVWAWVQNMVAIVIWQSSNPNQKRSARQTIRKGLTNANKITGTWVYILYKSVLPLLGAGIVVLLALQAGLFEYVYALIAVGLLVISAAYLSLSKLIKMTLMPYVILFEPKQSLEQASKRSAQMIARRGSIFLLFGYVLFTLTLAVTSGLSWFILNHTFGINWQIVASLFAIGFAILANGMLTAFYRKRRLARTK